jgi:hypothetical protein
MDNMVSIANALVRRGTMRDRPAGGVKFDIADLALAFLIDAKSGGQHGVDDRRGECDEHGIAKWHEPSVSDGP